MKGTLYGIGIGPGDPELITIKAARLLSAVKVVAIPGGARDGGSIALGIVRAHIPPETELVMLEFAMVTDEVTRERNRRDNAHRIAAYLDNGHDVACVTLGDAMLYSTYSYMARILIGEGFAVETIPGITSFCAAAARLNEALVQQDETLAVVPLTRETDIGKELIKADCVVFMKVSSSPGALVKALEGREDEFSVRMVSKCGAEGERIETTIEPLRGDVPYLTTVIVKKKSSTLPGKAVGGSNKTE